MTQLWKPKHLGMEVEWALKNHKYLAFKGNYTPKQSKKYLLFLKKAGYKMVPCCDNFDKIKGCLGVNK